MNEDYYPAWYPDDSHEGFQQWDERGYEEEEENQTVDTKMNADELFEAIRKSILHTDIDFEQVFVGDEESGEVYFKFCKVSEDQTND